MDFAIQVHELLNMFYYNIKELEQRGWHNSNASSEMEKELVIYTYDKRFSGQQKDNYDYLGFRRNLMALNVETLMVDLFFKGDHALLIFSVHAQIVGIITSDPESLPNELLENYNRFLESGYANKDHEKP